MERRIISRNMDASGSSRLMVHDNPLRTVFVKFKFWRKVREKIRKRVVFTYTIRYLRFKWDVNFSCSDLIRLSKALYPSFECRIPNTRFNTVFYKRDPASLQQASMMMLKYLQDVLDIQSATALANVTMQTFLGISASSFNPNLGRKGKEGWLKKFGGGHTSNQMGDCFRVWKWRWIVLHDICISWYKNPNDTIPRGIMQFDKDFTVTGNGRVLTIITGTRRLLVKASTRRVAEDWTIALTDFYIDSSRVVEHSFQTAYPPRNQCEVRAYTYTRDYFSALAKALLGAQSEILITSWMLCPTLLLTRPPYPTLRLDQILKYKADQGVKIFLLYKEVEYTGLELDSNGAKTYLESLCDNIHCIRHPNIVLGSSTAVIWSHHEKSVVIDRNLCFLGGVDLAFQRWDDEKHRVTDQDGTNFPGLDYHNPAPDLFKPMQQSVLPGPSASTINESIRAAVAPITNFNRGEKTAPEAANPAQGEGKANAPEPRDLYPRMPWHDVQVAVSGLTARDCASHFVQRWNHHRVSASHDSKPILFDITDNPDYGVCARCLTEGQSESTTQCTNCGHDLGPGSAYSAPSNPLKCPAPTESYAYISFECSCPATISFPFSMVGSGLVVVMTIDQKDSLAVGVLTSAHGAHEQTQQLASLGLIPAVGDIILSMNDTIVTHLDAAQLMRLMQRKRINDFRAGETEQIIRITFRRHFRENVSSADSADNKKPHDSILAAPAPAASCSTLLCAPLTLCTGSMVNINIDANPATPMDATCQAAAQTEVSHTMSTLFHTSYPFSIETLPRVCDNSGTCDVQLLRSIGTWSAGTRAESSILHCYLETIASAKYFIYIENQYFIGSTAGGDVSNSISAALVKRILQAHRSGEAFRVIVVIPIHPDDDFVNKFVPQAVMHYQYLTINRGAQSMFAQLLQAAPDMTIADYITFHSLRNYGIINNQIVSEQVYVHAKLMIVDDRIAIIGSANINDRSMLGPRDSELAVRIEDTHQVASRMNGQECTVGYLPHTLRVRLMRQHLGVDATHNLSDPLSPTTLELWTARSNANSAIYDRIDGDMSVYRCATVAQFQNALAEYVNLNYLDPEVQRTVAEIKGFLINWPLTLFENEDLSPPLAPRVLLPSEIWV